MERRRGDDTTGEVIEETRTGEIINTKGDEKVMCMLQDSLLS